MIVCIDMFSKFVVAEALPDKSSLTVAVFFHKYIICQFGCPRAVRSDNGTEFQGAFKELLEAYSIYRYPAVSYYPQAHGQVEVTNRTLRSVLRRLEY